MKSKDVHDSEAAPAVQFTVSEAVDDDVEFISVRGGALFARAHAGAMRPEDIEAYLQDAFSRARLLRHLQRPDNLFLVLRANSAQIGYARLVEGPRSSLVTHEPCIELRRLYVEEDWHGRGAAPLLLRHALVRSRERGHHACWLRVWERNARAIRFYEKHRFIVLGKEPSPYRESNPIALVMERPTHLAING